jgi:hypothetical protein
MRTDSSHLNAFRNRTHPQYKSDDTAGMNGFFVIPLEEGKKTFALVISGVGIEEYPWDHVSVRIGFSKYHGKLAERIPTWEEMCIIKGLFFEPEECAVQFHPPDEDYINQNPFVLNLWRPINFRFPMPAKEMV